MKNLDSFCSENIKKNKNLMIPWYLISSYGYYVENVSLLSDSFYDKLCFDLKFSIDQLSHPHKELVSKDALDAGTCLIQDYPRIVMLSFKKLLITHGD